MKNKFYACLILVTLVFFTLACGRSVPTPTPDAQATINAAVAATQAAVVSVQPVSNPEATVQAALAATSSAQLSLQATVNASVSATATAVPQPTPASTTEYVTLTEEELAALVDQAVTDATAAANQASTATAQATADDAVTQAEVQTVEVYVDGAEQAIAYAEEVLEAYADLYGDLAQETVALLTEVETDLQTLAENTAAINTSLQAINTSLQQGITLAEESIAQLEAAAQQASQSVAELQTQAQTWAADLTAEREARVEGALATLPDSVPADLQATLMSVFSFADGVRTSLADQKLTQDELAGIARLGANAGAGLKQQNGPQFQQWSESINQITGQLARGQVPQARTNLDRLERDLGNRPAGLGGNSGAPSGSRPSGPRK